MATLRLGGVISGLDTESIIQKILDVERLPIQRFQKEKDILTVQESAVSAIKSSFDILKTKLERLKDSSFFSSSIANTSDSSVATATASTSSVKNTYTFAISSLASASTLRSGTSLGPSAQKIANSIDPTALLTDNTSYGNSLTLGTFSVNGSNVTIDGTDTLNSVFTKISAATGGNVTGSYDATTDTITLTAGAGNVTLGSGADTSDFLSRSRLYTNGTNTVSSLTSIGTIDTAAVIGDASSRIGTAGTLTTGTISINGVSISIDKDADTLNDIMDRITSSTAGVFASYDSIEDRIVLTSKTTGSIGISVADGTSNFASSMKLTSSTSELDTGDDTTFTVNGGVARKSTDLTISATESGVTGLTVTASSIGTAVITVAADSSTVSTAFSDFVDQFNSVQNNISSFTQIPNSNTQPGDAASILSNDAIFSNLTTDLRRLVMASPGTGSIRTLEDLGITTTSDNNLLTFSDPSAFSTALANHFDEVVDLFTNSSTGIMNTLESYINDQTDSVSGSLPNRISDITKKQSNLDDSIAAVQTRVDQQEAQLVNAFTVLEQFQAQSNQILSFLQQKSSS